MRSIKIKKIRRILIPVCAILLLCSTQVSAKDNPLIFPIPQELQVTGQSFVLDETILIATPKNASEKDIALAKLLVKELSNKYGIALKIQIIDQIPAGKGLNVCFPQTILNFSMPAECWKGNALFVQTNREIHKRPKPARSGSVHTHDIAVQIVFC